MGGSTGASSGGLRLILLALLAAGLLLIPAAQASAEVQLVFEFEGTGTGTVECKANGGPAGTCAASYPEGTELEVVPVPNPGSEFVGFSGECGFLVCEFTMTGTEAVVSVEFEEIEEGEEETEPILTVELEGTGTGIVECEFESDGLPEECAPEWEYPEGTEVRLIPEPGPDSEFTGWGGSCSGTGNCELTMNGDHIVTVAFELKEGEEEPEKGGSGGSDGATTTPSTSSAPSAVVVAPGKLGVSGAALFQGGKAVLRLSCKGQGACKGSLKLVAKLKVGKGKAKSVEIGKAPFSLAAGVSTTLKVKLAGAAKKVLGKAKSVKATVSGSGVTKSTLTIMPTAR